MKKLYKLIKVIIVLILVFTLLYVLYEKYIEKNEIISIFNKSFLVVVTGSMEPEIKPKELIIINKQKNYNVGDIVTYKDDDNFIVTHRIVDIKNKKFIAKGDSNNINDEEQSVNKIYGKVILHSKILGIFILYILKPLIIIYLIFIICAEIYNSIKERKYEKDKK